MSQFGKRIRCQSLSTGRVLRFFIIWKNISRTVKHRYKFAFAAVFLKTGWKEKWFLWCNLVAYAFGWLPQFINSVSSAAWAGSVFSANFSPDYHFKFQGFNVHLCFIKDEQSDFREAGLSFWPCFGTVFAQWELFRQNDGPKIGVKREKVLKHLHPMEVPLSVLCAYLQVPSKLFMNHVPDIMPMQVEWSQFI